MTGPKSPEEARTPTISRRDGNTVVELIYDIDNAATSLAVSERKGTARILSEFRLPAGEVLVPYSATNNLIQHEAVLFASHPEPYGDKQKLLTDIGDYLHRYVDLPETFASVAAHYALLSWVHDAFSELPYLRLQGEFGTGKTRALIAIGSICYKPFFASGASTVSPIFHILDVFGGTLLLDEADFRFSDATSELVKILNNGSMARLPVLRTMQNRHKELNPRAFQVFGPKIVAMRHSYRDEGLESRFLTCRTGRRAVRPDIPVHLPADIHREARCLRNKLLQFRFDNLGSVAIEPSSPSSALSPRNRQIILPLLAIIDDAGQRNAVQQWALEQGQSRVTKRRAEVARRTAAAIQSAFASMPGNIIPLASIATIVNRVMNAAYTTKEIARIVRDDLGLGTHKSGGQYVIARSELVGLESSGTHSM